MKCVIFILAFALCAQALRAEDAPRPAEKAYRWKVYYSDELLKEVQGTATMDWENKRGYVVLKHPVTGGEYRLSATGVTPPDTKARTPASLTLRGRSPDAYTVKPPDDFLVQKVPAQAGAQVTIEFEGDELKTTVKPQDTPDKDTVDVVLQPEDDGDLAGRWSYRADPVTERAQGGVGRAGNLLVEPSLGTFRGLQAGREVWEQARPAIWYVQVVPALADPSGRATPDDQPMRPFPQQLKGVNEPRNDQVAGISPSANRMRTLLVVGPNLPLYQAERGWTQLGEIQPIAPEVRDEFHGVAAGTGTGAPDSYRVVAVWGDSNLSDTEKAVFEQGWKQLKEKENLSDEELKDARNSLDAALIRVGFNAGSIPGLRMFDWAGAQGEWVLQYGDNTADIHFVRQIQDKFEATPYAFVPEDLRVEIVTAVPLPVESLRVKLGHKGGGLTKQFVVASRVGEPGSGVYRTGVIHIVRDDAPQPASTEEPVIPTQLRNTLLAQVDAGPMPFVAPAMTSAQVLSSPGVVGGLWMEALDRAARADGVESRDWASLPNKKVEEVCHIIVFQADRVKTQISLGNHAAMLMLRDVFVEMMEEEDKQLAQTLEHPQFVLGFGAMAESALRRDPKFALGKLAAGKLKSEAMTLADACNKQKVDAAFAAEQDPVAAAEKWRASAFREAIGEYRKAIRTSIDMARNIPDGERQKLLKFTGVAFEPIVARLSPRLMRRNEAGLWVADEIARLSVEGLAEKAKEVRLYEDYASLDDQALLLAASAVANVPAIFTKCALGALFAFAVNCDIWAVNSVMQVVEARRNQEEVMFAFGATAALGTARYDDAALNDPSWAWIVTKVVGEGVLTSFQGFLAVKAFEREMTILRGSKTFDEFKGGLDGFRALKPKSQSDVIAFLTNAQALKRQGAALSVAQREGLARWEQLAAQADIKSEIAQAAIASEVRIRRAAAELNKEIAAMKNNYYGPPLTDEAVKIAKARIEDAELRTRLLAEILADASKDRSMLAAVRPDEIDWLRGKITDPDAALCDGLIKKFGSWEGIKDALGTGKISKADMHQFLACRKQRVDKLLAEVIADVEKEMSNRLGREVKLKRQAFGSTNLTSDYDISIVGEGAERVVGEFNQRFRKAFGGFESGFVFDTNVYTDPVYNIIKQGELNGGMARLQHFDLDELRQFIYDQMATRKYAHDLGEWQAHRSLIEGAADAETRKLIKYACDEAEAAHEAAQKMMAEQRAKLPADMLESNAGLRANNEAYAEVLGHIDDLRAERARLDRLYTGTKGLPPPPTKGYFEKVPSYAKEMAKIEADLADSAKYASARAQILKWQRGIDVQMRRKQGLALYFASEAYQAEGTITHVVYELQGPDKRLVDAAALLGKPAESKLTAAQYWNSFFENRANMLKELGHVRDHGKITKPAKAAAKAAKYFVRQLDAAHQAGINLETLKGVGADVIKRTVGVDKVRGELKDVEKFLQAEGISGEQFVEAVEQASNALARESAARGPFCDLARKLRGLLDDAELCRGTGELTPEMLGVPAAKPPP